MSLKPPKRGDNNGWMKKRQDKKIRIQPEYHLIVTEGEKTEPAYFQAIRDSINRQYPGRIQLDIFGEGEHTLGLFTTAQKRVRQSANIYRHVWIVYDTDDFKAEHINKTTELCMENSKENVDETQYHAIWSNQCIELWFLLHFDFFQSDIHRNEYWPKLTDRLSERGLGKYHKGRQDMYAILKPYLKTAISNAKRLDKMNEGKNPADAAPGTKVYELIELLGSYL